MINIIILNKGQSNAVHEGVKWIKKGNEPVFEISGPAGSGKSTIVASIISEMGFKYDEVVYVTYTGKAALALLLKDCNTSTIHSTFYELAEVEKKDDNGNTIMELGRPKKVLNFVKKPFISDKIKLIVVDECGMVPVNMYEDLLSFGIPILALGDLDQLPPIFGYSGFLQHPNIILTEVMRQAKDDPILYLADLARNKRYIHQGKYGDKCYVIDKRDITKYMLQNVDIIITGTNKTRVNINNFMRHDILKINSENPVKGDKLICRKNRWGVMLDDKYPLINGMVGYNMSDASYDRYDLARNSLSIDFRPDFLEHSYFEDLAIDLEYLKDTNSKKNSDPKYRWRDTERMEYAYAITGHLSQGSQYSSVLVYNEYLGGNIYNKWLYTVLTRAVDFLILAV